MERVLDERGEVRDDASPALARIRSDLRAAHDRLIARLQRIISSPETAPFLQEPIITIREGRYVIPLKADFKGRIRGIVHDRSASGATLFIEPLPVVELGNTWRELQVAEEQEIRRILADLSARVAARGAEILATVDALADLDLAFAKARYADELDAVEPVMMTDGARGAENNVRSPARSEAECREDARSAARSEAECRENVRSAARSEAECRENARSAARSEAECRENARSAARSEAECREDARSAARSEAECRETLVVRHARGGVPKRS